MSLAKLTSISTKTLSLLLERQRLQTLPPYTPTGGPTSPLHDANAGTTSPPSTHHLNQIKKNLEQLRNGIVAMQAKDGDSEAVGLLRNQYERMRGMLGSDAAGVPSLLQASSGSSESSSSSSPSPSPSPVPRAPLPSKGISGGPSGGASKQAALFLSSSEVPPPSSSSHVRSDSTVFQPYKDDPSAIPITNTRGGTDQDDQDDDTHALLQSQRFMMSEQDQRLDELSHSINRQHHLSIQINDEMDIHHGLLEDLDHGIDRTAGRLGTAKRSLDKVAKGIKENSSVFMIGVLIFVLLILIIVLKT